MSVDKLPSGKWRARLQIDGRRHVATFQTKQQAQEWETVTRAQGIQGTLPSHVTVGQYADKWLAGYEHAPANTRRFHRINLAQWILPHFADRRAAAVSPTDITMLLNRISDRVSPARAERVYRTLSALFRSAHADDVVPKVPTRSKRHRPRRQKEPHAVLERIASRGPQQSLSDVAASLPDPLPRRTPMTICSMKALHDDLEKTRSRGVAIDNEENTVGIRCFSVAIISQQDAAYAISCSVPLTRLDLDREEEIIAHLREVQSRFAAYGSR